MKIYGIYKHDHNPVVLFDQFSCLIPCGCWRFCPLTLQWRRNGRESVSNRQPHDGLINRLFRRRSRKTSKIRVIGLCVGNSPGTGEFPAQMASYAENVSIWWRHHDVMFFCGKPCCHSEQQTMWAPLAQGSHAICVGLSVSVCDLYKDTRIEGHRGSIRGE